MKAALLFAKVGRPLQRIIVNNWKISAADRSDLKKLIKAIDKHIKPKDSTYAARFRFRNRYRQPGESLQSYIQALEQLIVPCQYDKVQPSDMADTMIMDNLILSIRETSLQLQMFSKEDLTLDQVKTAIELYEARSQDVSTIQASRASTKDTYQVNHISRRDPRQIRQQSRRGNYYQPRGNQENSHRRSDWRDGWDSRQRTYSSSSEGSPHRTSSRHSSYRSPSPKWKRRYNPDHEDDQPCEFCGRWNHNTASCWYKKRHETTEEDKLNHKSVQSFYVTSVQLQDNCLTDYSWYQAATIDGWANVNFKLDTAAEINLISLDIICQLNLVKKIQPANIEIVSCGGFTWEPVGTLLLDCQIEEHSEYLQFFIVPEQETNILGMKACCAFNLICRTSPAERKQGISLHPSLNLTYSEHQISQSNDSGFPMPQQSLASNSPADDSFIPTKDISLSVCQKEPYLPKLRDNLPLSATQETKEAKLNRNQDSPGRKNLSGKQASPQLKPDGKPSKDRCPKPVQDYQRKGEG